MFNQKQPQPDQNPAPLSAESILSMLDHEDFTASMNKGLLSEMFLHYVTTAEFSERKDIAEKHRQIRYLYYVLSLQFGYVEGGSGIGDLG